MRTRSTARAWLRLGLCAAALGAGGCSMTAFSSVRITPQELADAKEQIRSLLARFEKAVQEDDMKTLTELLSPSLSETSLQDILGDWRQAVYTQMYGDYKLYYDKVVEKISPRAAAKGRIVMEIPFRAGSGEVLRDRFVFRRWKGKWYIGDAHLRPPRPGDLLDLPPDVHREIMDQVATCVNALKMGDAGFGAFITAVEEKQHYSAKTDKEEFRKNYKEWMASIEMLFHAQIRHIIFSPQRTPIRFDANDQVSVLAPLEMKYPPTADEKFKKVTLLFLLAKTPRGWRIIDVKCSRKASVGERFSRWLRSFD